jgi:non-specific serine/threonine protein kinase
MRWVARDLRTLPETIECMAAVAAAGSEGRRAAVLLGAAQAVREFTGAALLPWLQAGRDATQDLVRNQLGDEESEALRLEGSRKELDAAVEYALAAGTSSPTERPANVNHRLTRREREVVGMLALGRSNKQIAAALQISGRTVEAHVEHLRTKLGVSTRAQAGIWAVQHGLVDLTG